jgi:hypothetical protein
MIARAIFFPIDGLAAFRGDWRLCEQESMGITDGGFCHGSFGLLLLRVLGGL